MTSKNAALVAKVTVRRRPLADNRRVMDKTEAGHQQPAKTETLPLIAPETCPEGCWDWGHVGGGAGL